MAAIYDVTSWLWEQFRRADLNDAFRQEATRIFAAYGLAWDLGVDGRLYRVLPVAAQEQVSAVIGELGEARFAAAAELFGAARDAYDERPRRDRDACGNAFDALESVAKIKYVRPDDTFGQVKNYMAENRLAKPEIIEIFTELNRIRNRFFGHGMVVAFDLAPAEVDFVYLSCISCILFLTRTP
jgi:hypothetical protein